MDTIRLECASPPDREHVVIQFMIGSEQIAELNHEDESLQLELYARRDHKPWIVEYSEFIKSLVDAEQKLAGLAARKG